MLIVVEATFLCGHIKPTNRDAKAGPKYLNLADVTAEIVSGGDQDEITGCEDTGGSNMLTFLPYFGRRNNRLNMNKIAQGDKGIRDKGIAFTKLCTSSRVAESMRPYKTMKEAAYVAFVRSVCEGCDMVVVDVRDDRVQVYAHRYHRHCSTESAQAVIKAIDEGNAFNKFAPDTDPKDADTFSEEKLRALATAYQAADLKDFSIGAINALRTVTFDNDKVAVELAANKAWTGLNCSSFKQLGAIKLDKTEIMKKCTKNFKYHVLTISHPPAGPAYLQATDGTGFAFLEPKPCDDIPDHVGQFKTYHDESDAGDFWDMGLRVMKILLPGYQKSPGAWKSKMSKYILRWPNLRKLGRSKKWILCVIPDTGKFYKIERDFQGGNAEVPLYRGNKMYRVSKAFVEACAGMSDGVCKDTGSGSASRCLPRGLCPSSAPFMPLEWVEKAQKCWMRVKPDASKAVNFQIDSRIRRFQLTRAKVFQLRRMNERASMTGDGHKYMVLVTGDLLGTAESHASDSGSDLPPGFQNGTATSSFVTKNQKPVYALSQDFLDAVMDFNGSK